MIWRHPFSQDAENGPWPSLEFRDGTTTIKVQFSVLDGGRGEGETNISEAIIQKCCVFLEMPFKLLGSHFPILFYRNDLV